MFLINSYIIKIAIFSLLNYSSVRLYTVLYSIFIRYDKALQRIQQSCGLLLSYYVKKIETNLCKNLKLVKFFSWNNFIFTHTFKWAIQNKTKNKPSKDKMQIRPFVSKTLWLLPNKTFYILKGFILCSKYIYRNLLFRFLFLSRRGWKYIGVWKTRIQLKEGYIVLNDISQPLTPFYYI